MTQFGLGSLLGKLGLGGGGQQAPQAPQAPPEPPRPESDDRDQGRPVPDQVPSGQRPPEIPREVRKRFKEIAEWTDDHHKASLARREHLDRSWTRVMSYMEGFHYFHIDRTGQWRPLPKKNNEIRATVPIMRSAFRREVGRFAENIITARTQPTSSKNPMSFHHSRSAEAILNQWHDDIDLPGVWEDWASQQIHFGLSGLYRWSDPFRKQVFVQAWPGPELHPIPWDATRDHELQGFMRVKWMPESWLLQNLGQDAANLANETRGGGGFLSISSNSRQTKDSKGAVVKWVWLLGTPDIPTGQHYVQVEDRIFGYKTQGSLRNGKLPIEFARYSTMQDNWYGMGMLSTLLGAQGEADRQWSRIVTSSRLNSGMLLFNDEVISREDIDGPHQFIPFDNAAYNIQSDGPFFHHIPAIPTNRDVGVVLTIAQENANRAAGHESDLLFGRSEGRVESGRAQQQLLQNAQTPIAPTLGRMGRGLVNTYMDVLDMLREVWPEEKTVRVVGRYDLAEELTIKKDQVPASKSVIVRLGPLLPGGRQEMASMLYNFRQMIAEDNKPEITSAEFRSGLNKIGMAPPGIDFVDKVDQRIEQRVSELFNDGETPGKFVGSELEMAILKMEDIDELGRKLKDRLLSPGFRAIASQQVQQAFVEILKMLTDLKLGDPNAGDGFDQNLDIQAFDAARMEESLFAQEANLSNPQGEFTSELPGE